MSYQFIPNKRYRMPTHFGPSLGPRQGIDDRRYPCIDAPNVKIAQATFKADPSQLERFLPPGFTLRDPHNITFFFEYLSNVEWLAGRGYNTFGATIPASFIGKQETLHGDLLLVIWENMADCIITGREDLGYAKIYCEIPEPQMMEDNIVCRASWDGFEFARLKLSNVNDVALADLPEPPPSDGRLHYKYIPKTGVPGEADAEYAVLEPASFPNVKLDQVKLAKQSSIQFQRGNWEQLPTIVHIVDALAAISLGKCIEAAWISIHGGKDLSDMRIIR